MSKFKHGDLVIVSQDGKDRNGMVAMQDGAVLTHEAYIVLMQDTGERALWHVNKLRPFASSFDIAMDVVRSLERIQNLKKLITEELDKIEQRMVQDGQPSYELDVVKEMRTVNRAANRYELSFMQTAWTGYAMERKTKR
jgi:hypothetical protein